MVGHYLVPGGDITKSIPPSVRYIAVLCVSPVSTADVRYTYQHIMRFASEEIIVCQTSRSIMSTQDHAGLYLPVTFIDPLDADH
jgi:hypothetical protein